MIPRYSREKISKIWSEESMYNYWLQVEIATCEAWNELGIIPKEGPSPSRCACHNSSVTSFLTM